VSKTATDRATQAAIITHLDNTPLPSMGDPAMQWTFILSEPEINAIHAAMGFVKAACASAGMPNYWKHYGPTLETLSKRLAEETE